MGFFSFIRGRGGGNVYGIDISRAVSTQFFIRRAFFHGEES